MNQIGFDNEKYMQLQSEHIRERISEFGGKLYMEFGGKLFDDYHASRVLPGFKPDSKVNMLLRMKDDAEIVIVINSNDIEKNRVRGDLGITYDDDVLRLIDAFREIGLYVGSVVLAQYQAQPLAKAFREKLKKLGVKVYLHYIIDGYPSAVSKILSEEGFGKNEYIETTRPLVVVTAPGPGSGKMATCLSQLYHDNKRGIKAGYAKFETFPVWNLPLKHPVNLAYEAATANLNDVNMIDPFYLAAHKDDPDGNNQAVNYNRDVEIFPVLNTIFERIYGVSPYDSPTAMGVNMVGYCITDEDVVIKASNQEIIRRYYAALCAQRMDVLITDEEVFKNEMIMNQAGVTTLDRPVIGAALEKEKKTKGPAVAIELNDGTIVTGKTSNLLGASAAALLNALKVLAGINDRIHLISPEIIEPIQTLKTEYLGNHNPRLHTDEILIALTICAQTDDNAKAAVEKLKDLAGAEAHSTVLLSAVDESVFKKLGVNLTCEPNYNTKKLYHKKA